MEELEYLFKHALAQETAYESTLIYQRKRLHKKVAQAIEKIFTHRLHEFYGMLAFHYSRAEDIEKTEEYMIKAGEEALRASASNEALHYFQEALQLFLDKYGDDANPEKLAIFEKNIALAFYNKAKWAEALEYFAVVLKRWDYPLPQKGFIGKIRLAWDWGVILMAILWRFPKNKKLPKDHDNEALDLFFKAGMSQTFVDNDMQFLMLPMWFRYLKKFNLSKIPKLSLYLSVLSAGCNSYGYLWLGKRLLHISKKYCNNNDLSCKISYTFSQDLLNLHHGNWSKIGRLDKDLISESERVGDFFYANIILWTHGLQKVKQGDKRALKLVIEQYSELEESYDYVQAAINAHLLKADHLIERRALVEAVSESEKIIVLAQERENELNEMMALSIKAEAQQLTGDTEGANRSISQASEIRNKQSTFVHVVFLCRYLTARFFIKIHQLEDTLSTVNSSGTKNIRKEVIKSGKEAVRYVYKYAPIRTKTMRLMGLYYWLANKQLKAFKWWDKAIQEGEHLGAYPDLSRTYFEVGKRLLEPRSKYRDLNGISAKDYLKKARVLFAKMELQWDIDELEKIGLDV